MALLCGANAHAQSVPDWFVDHTADEGDETGEDWANAFLTIQDALANELLEAGDVIAVAGRGVDFPYLASTSGNRVHSIVIDAGAEPNHDGITLRGGYAGLGASNPSFFCPRTNVTVISGDLDEDDANGLNTAWDDSSRDDNSIHVLRVAGVGSDTVIEGFTIAGGNADSTDFFGGAAVVEDGAEVWFIDCIFANNSALADGEQGRGGAVFIDTPSSTKAVQFLLCRFFNNTADQGGAVYLAGDDSSSVQTQATFANCIMHDNLAIVSGGLQFKPRGSGAVVYVRDNAHATIANCTIADNEAENDGAAVYLAKEASGEFEPSATIVSSIVWGNMVDTDVDHFGIFDDDGSLIVTYSDVEDGHAGTGNLSPPVNPQLNPTTYIAGSAAIRNVGDPTPTDVPTDVFDLNKNDNTSERTPDYRRDHRVSGTAIDMGAYEFYQAGTCQADINADGSVNVTDLLLLLAKWCSSGCCTTIISPADFSHNGTVDVSDLLTMLATWGCEAPSSPVSNSVQGPSLASYDSQFGPVSDKWDNSGGVRYRLAADDFKTIDAESITTVHWWGFYEDSGDDCESGYTDGFTITYYDSQIHGSTGERIPGSVVATRSVTPTRFETEMAVNGDVPVYLYLATHTGVSLDSGGCYFIEIKNSGGDTNGASGCHWRWAWSSEGDIEYSNVKGEAEASYAAASNPKKVKNLAFSIGIEFDWEQIDVLCALSFQ